MNELFHIGETALIRSDILLRIEPALRPYLGELVVIEGEPRIAPGDSFPMYLVRCLSDHALLLASPRALKRLPPGPQPTDMLDTTQPLKVTRWSDSPWVPTKVRA